MATLVKDKMMPGPINIKEIREKTKKAQSVVIGRDIQNINNLINKAALEGEYRTVYKGIWNTKNQVKLAEIYKKEGYGVDRMPGAIEITW